MSKITDEELQKILKQLKELKDENGYPLFAGLFCISPETTDEELELFKEKMEHLKNGGKES